MTRTMTRAILITAPLLLLTGCERPWQHARTVVAASAEAVAAGDAAVVDAYAESGCQETEDVTDLGACVERLQRAVEALEVARAAVMEGEVLVDLWERAEERPGEWRGWLASLGQVFARLAALLDAAGVDVPDDVESIAELVDSILEGGVP